MLSKTHLVIMDLLVVWVSLLIYICFPFAELRLDDDFEWCFQENNTEQILLILGLIYIPISIWNVQQKNNIEQTRIGSLLLDKSQTKKNILIYLLKFFFIPSMLSLTISNGWILIEHLVCIVEIQSNEFTEVFKNHLYPIVIYGELFFATAIYTLGYLIESKKLKNEIKSIDQTVLGWIVTLVCYYPMYIAISLLLPMMTNDFAYFINDSFTLLVWLFLIPIHVFKLWCVIKLGWKCSNLTNRGIITDGPYRYVRHPHYLSKLLIWWITFLPILIFKPIFLIGMLFWTFIYFLRAITEEKHLNSDNIYREYKKEVRYRFIPGII